MEVHAKDAFGGANPFAMTSTRYRNKRIRCKEHQPPANGFGKADLTRIIWLISREGCVEMPVTRIVSGKWVKCTLGEEWGCEV